MSIVESICQELQKKKNLALVSIVKQLASAPRHAGSCMLVDEEGLVAGTIGGGLLEGQAIERGMEVAKSGRSEFMDFKLTGKDAASAGMICGGSMRLFLEPIRPESRTQVLYQRLAIAMGCGDDMFSVIPVRAPGRRVLCRKKAATWPIPTEIACILREKLEKGELDVPLEISDSMGQNFVVIPWSAPWRLVLAGGGHVAQATAEIAARADFTVCVLDDREEFANKDRFPMAAVVRAVPEYRDCFAGMALENKTLVVIVTRGHSYDKSVLVQALKEKPAYLGMIGSKRKIRTIYDMLLNEEGFAKEDLVRVTAPVGLDIGAETPAEIGISIVAQLIAARAVLDGGRHHLDASLAGQVQGADKAQEAEGRESSGLCESGAGCETAG